MRRTWRRRAGTLHSAFDAPLLQNLTKNQRRRIEDLLLSLRMQR